MAFVSPHKLHLRTNVVRKTQCALTTHPAYLLNVLSIYRLLIMNRQSFGQTISKFLADMLNKICCVFLCSRSDVNFDSCVFLAPASDLAWLCFPLHIPASFVQVLLTSGIPVLNTFYHVCMLFLILFSSIFACILFCHCFVLLTCLL